MIKESIEFDEISKLQDKKEKEGVKSPSSERLTKEEKEQKLREEKELAVLSEEELRKDREAFNLVSAAKRIEEAQERERKAQEAEKINEKRIIASQSTILNNLKKEVEDEINANKSLKEKLKYHLDNFNQYQEKYLATFLYYDLYKQIKEVEQEKLAQYKIKFPSYFKYDLSYNIAEDDINLMISNYFYTQSSKIVKFDLGYKAEYFKEKYAEEIKTKFKEYEKIEKIQELRNKKLVDLSNEEIEKFIRSLECTKERFLYITFETNEKIGIRFIKINYDFINSAEYHIKHNCKKSLLSVQKDLKALFNNN